jgi:threonyl-tRNA synthetase
MPLKMTASRILAAAALQVFPNSALRGGGAFRSTFYYDLVFPFVFQKEMVPLLEEAMRGLIKKGSAIHLLEMVPSNAAEFLSHHRQMARAAAALKEQETLIELMQIEDFVDLCPGPYLETTREVGAFRLYDHALLENGSVRIFGAAFATALELKDYFRHKKQEKVPLDHMAIGKKLDLFSRSGGGLVWHPQGEALKQFLLQSWRDALAKEGFVFLSTPSAEEAAKAHFDFFLKREGAALPFKTAEMRRYAEEEGEYMTDRCHIFCSAETVVQNLISSLQFMKKFSTIFPFEPKWVLHLSSKGQEPLQEALEVAGIAYQIDGRKRPLYGAELVAMAEDHLGRRWAVSSLRVERQLGSQVGWPGALIVQTLFSSLERGIALALEEAQGIWYKEKERLV